MGVRSSAKARFNEVFLFAEKSGKCGVCGKRCKRREKFSQTLNPFNKNADGSVKDKSQIIHELAAASVAWQSEPIFHSRCE